MIEYAKCIYTSWAQSLSPQEQYTQQEEYIQLTARLLNRTPEEVRERMQYYIDLQYEKQNPSLYNRSN